MARRGPSTRMYGGTRINIGCVPTKALVYQAEHPDPRDTPEDWFARAAERTTTLTAAMRAKAGDRVRVAYEDAEGNGDVVEGDLVLAALGRRPVTDGLRLDEAGIAVGERGEVVVDEHLRTSLPHVYAVGDVNGGPQFTYVSLDDYRIVLDQLTGDGTRSTRDRVAVPHVVFTTPPLARVSLTAAEAAATGRPLKTAVRRVADMATVPRARTDEILGVTLLAHDAHETINTLAVAMRHGATAASLRDGIYTHPTMTESLNALFANLV